MREFTSKFTTIYTDIHKIHPNIKINLPSFTQGLLWYTPVWPHMLRFTPPVIWDTATHVGVTIVGFAHCGGIAYFLLAHNPF